MTYLLIANSFYVELLGFVALMSESTLGVPQLVKNHRKRSTKGMSEIMVIMWLSGDMFKAVYSVVREAPAQFYICAGIQVLVDLLILGQAAWFRRPRVGYWRLPKTG